MIAYLVRRVLWIIPVLFTVSILTFILMHSVPGGPWDREKALPDARPGDAQRQVRARQAAPRPIPHMGRRLHPGRPGPVIPVPGSPVNDIVADGLPITVQLGVMAFLLAVRHRHPARHLRRPGP